MKKKALSLALALALCLSLLSVTSLAANSDFIIEGDVLLYYTGTGSSVSIPSSVTSIGQNAFNSCDTVTSVNIPSSVTSIGYNAFGFCTGLTNVTIPTSVTSIGDNAFCNCTSLTSVTIPSSITSIGMAVFFECRGLRSVNIPSSVTSIGPDAFAECESLTSVTIPSSVTSIGTGAFSDCDSLTSITIPSSVTSIPEGMLLGCKGLTSITISSGVTSIGGGAFAECDKLADVTIPSSVTSIGSDVFLNCASLTDIYYAGSEEQWNKIQVDNGYDMNTWMHNATIHYSGSSPSAPKPGTPAVTAENIPASGTSIASTQTVAVDGKKVEFQMYALRDANGNLTNYIKLRDMAYILNGTQAQFAVDYDGTISLTTGQAYQAVGTEMTTPFSGDQTYKGGTQSVKINGSAVDITAITLTDDNGGRYNYFKLRDLGKALGFYVGYSNDTGIYIDSTKPYAE